MREIVARDSGQLAHGTVIATTNQTAGRGRLDRDWVTPPDVALAASVLVRPNISASGLGLSWLPLLVGSALVAALQPLFRGSAGSAGSEGSESSDGSEVGEAKRVGVKWPNDVHVRDEGDAMQGRPGQKLCGILCEVLPSGDVVVGFGVNLLQDEWQLPTERAGSVLASGGDVAGAVTLADPNGQALVDRVLATAVAELLRLVQLAADEPDAARVRVKRDSVTLGAEVRVHMPNGPIADGRAVDLDRDGALIVDRPTGGQLVVNAADIEHLR